MIKTNEFRLNDQELKTAYYAIINRNILWILACFIVIVIFILYLIKLDILFLAICIIAYFIALKLGFNQFKNNPFHQETSFIEINDNFISQTYANGCVVKLNLNLIQWVLKKDNVYVFMRQNQMPFIFPARALNSGEEVKLPLRKNVFFQIYDEKQ